MHIHIHLCTHTHSHIEASNMKLLILSLAVLEMGSNMNSTDRGKFMFSYRLLACVFGNILLPLNHTTDQSRKRIMFSLENR